MNPSDWSEKASIIRSGVASDLRLTTYDNVEVETPTHADVNEEIITKLRHGRLPVFILSVIDTLDELLSNNK